MFSIILNFGIGKSVISINNIPNKKKEISFKALSYTTYISILILILIILLYLFKEFLCLIILSFINLLYTYYLDQ